MPDMHELLEAAKAGAPPPRFGVDDIVAAGRRRRRWASTQRIGGVTVVAVAGVTGLLLVASNLALSGHGTGTRPAGGRPAAARPAAPPTPEVPPFTFTFTFTGYRVGDYRVLPPIEITQTHQVASIVVDYLAGSGKKATAFVGNLTVYRPNVVPPAAVAPGTGLTVQGRAAVQRQEVEQSPVTDYRRGSVTYGRPTATAGPPSMLDVLAWQYADNAWAVIASQPDNPAHVLSAATELSLADAFRTGPPIRAKVPFQPGYLPAGSQLVSVSGQSFTAEDTGMVTVRYANPDLAPPPSLSRRDLTDPPAVVISIGQQDTPPRDAPKKKKKCSAEERWCTWPVAGTRFYLLVEDPSKTLSTEELLKVGQGLVFDNLDEPDTWHPVP
jgi:hypothetical protein